MVEPDLDRISRGAEKKTLRPQVMNLLIYLAEHDGQLCRSEDLFKDLWPNKVVSDATLYNCVAELRHQLDEEADSPNSIQTIPKKGYRLAGGIRFISAATGAAANSDQPLRSRPITRIFIGLLAITLSAAVVVISGYSGVTRPVVTEYKKISNSQVIMPPVSSPLAITADESRLYFAQFLDGNLTPSQLAQSGGEAVQFRLPITDNDSVSGINGMTPDRASFLVEHYPNVRITRSLSSELWTVPVVGGSPRRLGKGRQGAFSPSGDKLVFMKDSVNMFSAKSDMSDAHKIASLAYRVYWIRFSPDGTRIRFTQELDHYANTLWELKLGDSEPYRLLQDWPVKSSCCGSWTPDGKYFVFQARADNRTQLWAIENADNGGIESSEPFQITTGAIDFLRPTISADGKTIFATGWQLRGEIHEYDNATGSFSSIPGLESMSVEQVSYSRDEQFVAYITYPDGALWRKNINGGDSLQLTFEPMRSAQPVWSPDGSEIAFMGWVPGEPYKVYVVSANGGKPSLISTGDSNSRSPSWSSDGERLVFSNTASDQLQVYDLTLATTANMPGTSGARSPTWSPDGKSIAAQSGENLILYDVDSQESTILLKNARYHFKYWSAESDALYLVDSFLVGRERSVYHLNIEDKKLSKIAVVGNLRNTWGTLSQWVGVKPDGTPILLRDQSIHNIYALEWDTD